MSVLADRIHTLLDATSGVAGIVGSRHYTLRAQQGTAVPYLIVSIPARNVTGHLRGITDLERATVRFDSFGVNYLQLDALRNAIISTMALAVALGAQHTFGSEIYEDDTRYFHFIDDFSVWYQMS